MPEESFKRKLTAILGADVKGYRCLMREAAIEQKELAICHNSS